MVPAFQKSSKKELEDCHPIFSIPGLVKIFGGLLYKSMFKSFTENSLTLQKQSGFNRMTREINYSY